MLFAHFQNPYQSPTLNVMLPQPGYGGFKYGPIMILGYLPSAFFPQSGYKMMSALYLLLSLALSWLLELATRLCPGQKPGHGCFCSHPGAHTRTSWA